MTGQDGRRGETTDAILRHGPFSQLGIDMRMTPIRFDAHKATGTAEMITRRSIVPVASLPPLQAKLASLIGADGRLTVRSVKLFADGALGSRGAALLEDYLDQPGWKGLLLSKEETWEPVIKQWHEAVSLSLRNRSITERLRGGKWSVAF